MPVSGSIRVCQTDQMLSHGNLLMLSPCCSQVLFLLLFKLSDQMVVCVTSDIFRKVVPFHSQAPSCATLDMLNVVGTADSNNGRACQTGTYPQPCPGPFHTAGCNSGKTAGDMKAGPRLHLHSLQQSDCKPQEPGMQTCWGQAHGTLIREVLQMLQVGLRSSQACRCLQFTLLAKKLINRWWTAFRSVKQDLS